MLRAARLGRRLLSSGQLGEFGHETARWAAGLHSQCNALVLERHGAPEEALTLKKSEISSELLGEQDILINILAAPINPSDINTIEGRYPLKPALPGIPGHEGVGVVEAVGSRVNRMKVGDRVVPIEHSQGTWRSHGIFHQQHWYKIPKDLPIATAATMVINPPTALRLLEEFVTLQSGDTVIQTGGSSAVGKYIIQLARQRGVHTVNIVRDRANRPEVEKELRELGATVVATAEEVEEALESSGLDRPKLALDCVAGPAATTMARLLAPGGTMVCYGSMSREPLTIPSSLLIFKDIRLRGFWLTGGYAKMKEGWKAKEQLADRVCALFRQKVIKPVRVDCVPLEQWQDALQKANEDFRDCKVLLTNHPHDACQEGQ